MMQRATKVMLLSLFFLIAGAVGTTKDSLEDVEKCYISFTDEKGSLRLSIVKYLSHCESWVGNKCEYLHVINIICLIDIASATKNRKRQ